MSTLFTSTHKIVNNDTFIKTPRMIKLFPCVESVERSKKLKDIGLHGILWQTYRVNALYNFSYKNKELKKYQINLASYIKTAFIKNQLESSVKSKEFIVKIKPLPITAFTERDSPAVTITIKSEDEGYRMKCFTGLLLSISRKEGVLEKERKEAGAVILPLLLVDYENKIFLESVLSFLKDNFHCFIGPLKFSPYDLMWMLALLSCPDNKISTSATILEYKLPLEDLNSLEYAIDPKSMYLTWKRIIKPNATGEISEDQVDIFLSELETHFYKMYSIDLSKFQLSVIKTSTARIKGNQTIIVWESNELFSIMKHLTNLSQEIRM